MAKSIRSKVKKRFRTAKRTLVSASVDQERAKSSFSILNVVAKGLTSTIKKQKNAFKYPQDTDAVFPTVSQPVPLDFRSQSMPHSGYATVNNRRKFMEGEKQEVIALNIGGSIRSTFAVTASTKLQHDECGAKSIVPSKRTDIPKLKVISKRRNRNERKTERGSGR
jgi:Protein of unknown function (DUF2423)